MPGFGGGDYTLLALAVWLRRIGYKPHIAGFVDEHRLLGSRVSTESSAERKRSTRPTGVVWR